MTAFLHDRPGWYGTLWALVWAVVAAALTSLLDLPAAVTVLVAVAVGLVVGPAFAFAWRRGRVPRGQSLAEGDRGRP